jgi:hypothetical protein
MNRRSVTTATAVASVSLALVLAPTTSASAHESHDSHDGHAGSHNTWHRTLTDDVVAPFNLAIEDGQVYVADGATSMVSTIRKDGTLKTAAAGPQPGEVAGVDAEGGYLAYTATNYATGATTLTVKREGRPDVVADLSGYEANVNPDGKQTYGLRPGASQCAKDFAAQATGHPATYTGVVDSHPYSVVFIGHGSFAVADAAANAILKVDRQGNISTLAVLPSQPTKFTADMAKALGAPDCVVGVTYRFEAVPTDVEVDGHGKLLVSTLPGGPEDPSLGARGSVYRVDMKSGHAKRLATGFAGATNLAVAKDGTIYVAELFGGKVSAVRHGHVKTWRMFDQPVSVEVAGNYVYVGTLAPMDDMGNPTGTGTVQVFRR